MRREHGTALRQPETAALHTVRTENNMDLVIAPSVLACDLTRLGESVRAAEDGGADWHHMDVMDGHFVPNITFGPDIVQAVKNSSELPIDVHLMIEEPDRYVEPFVKAGADYVTFHIEAMPEPRPLLQRIRDLGALPGLVVKPATPASAVLPYLDAVALILVMTVEPGFTGQKFMADQLPKIAALRREAGPDLNIAVDGGINEQTAVQIARAGANVAVAGAFVYRSGDIPGKIAALRQVMKENIV